MNTSDRIALRRVELGLSQAELASAIGVTVTVVNRWERRGCSPPTVRNIEALAEALAVEPGWLAFGAGPKTSAAVKRAYAELAAEGEAERIAEQTKDGVD